jgi:hypothetical protein
MSIYKIEYHIMAKIVKMFLGKGAWQLKRINKTEEIIIFFYKNYSLIILLYIFIYLILDYFMVYLCNFWGGY